jgi:zinc protease
MRKIWAVLLVIAGLLCTFSQGGLTVFGQQKERPIDKLKFPPLNFSPPAAEKFELANGMTIFILEDHEVPTINLYAMIRGGELYDPADKVGLADLAATVMRSGGTKSRAPEAMNQALEFVSASVETGMSDEYGTAEMSSLTKDLDTVLPIFADVLMNPAFRDEQLEIARNQVLDSLQRQNDSPGEIASRIFPQLIYGRDSLLARNPNEETIKKITKEDLIQFHDKFYHPNNVILGISGDVNKAEIRQKLEQVFAGWSGQELPPAPAVAVPAAAKRSIYFVHKDIDQATVRIGNLGIKENDPDYFAVSVANDILGSGFSSRIVNELRTKEGLAYVAGAFQSGGLGEPGIFMTISETRADSTTKSIEIILRLLDQMRAEPVTDTELTIAKESALNSFVFSYDSPSKIVNQVVELQYFGMPLDFLQRYKDNVAKVTKEDILRVSKKYYHPDTATILVVGDEKQFDKPLSSVAPVTVIDLDKWK